MSAKKSCKEKQEHRAMKVKNTGGIEVHHASDAAVVVDGTNQGAVQRWVTETKLCTRQPGDTNWHRCSIHC